jgi:hypothetical protein
MTTATELIKAVEGRGGRLFVEDEYLVVVPRKAGEPLAEELLRHKQEIIALLQSRSEQETESAPDDPLLGDWLLEQCVFKDRWWGGIGGLYLDLARWCADHGRSAPASRRTFTAALQEEGFTVTMDGLVYGLVLKEDLDAHKRFQDAPGRTTAERRRA